MPARLSRNRGLIALLVASLAWLGVVLAGRAGAGGPWLTLLRHAFEGAMVGGVADWFAVRALFRRIPIPLLERHTNILSKNRPRLTEGIVDMVQNQWLAPAVVRERLQQVSLSGMALHYLQQPAARLALQQQLRQIVVQVGDALDQQQLTDFLTGLAAHHLQQLDLRQAVLRPLITAVEDDAVFNQAWQGGRVVLRQLFARSEVRELLHVGLEQLIDRYLDEAQTRGVGSHTWARIKLRLGLPRSELRRPWLDARLDRIVERLEEDQGDAELAARVRSQLLQLLYGLQDENSELMGGLQQQLVALAERLHGSRTLHELLTGARHATLRQLQNDHSPLSLWLAELVDDSLDRLAASADLQQRVDQTLASLLLALMERNPDAIGATVRHALSPTRLSDEALIRQIEDKVGDDLDWIRVNGAVVGGLVAGLLGALQMVA